MQAEQGLWELPPEDETAIVAYLARHYPRAAAGPRRPPLAGHQYPRAAAGSRRPPLAAHLLPAVPSNSQRRRRRRPELLMKRERTLEELGTDPGGVDWALLGPSRPPDDTARLHEGRRAHRSGRARRRAHPVCLRDSFGLGCLRCFRRIRATVLPGKDPGLVLLNDRPLNAETPAHLLDDDVTPASRLFVRNNGEPPSGVDASSWTLTLDGESVEREVSIRLSELKQRLEAHTLQLQLECAGNGRSEFRPPARGNQWTTGAIGCPSFTGRTAAGRPRARRCEARRRVRRLLRRRHPHQR